MHNLIWQLLQLMIRKARDLHEPEGPTDPEYTRGQVNLIMDTVGLAGDYDGAVTSIYAILTEVLTHKIGEIDALVKIQRVVRDSGNG